MKTKYFTLPMFILLMTLVVQNAWAVIDGFSLKSPNGEHEATTYSTGLQGVRMGNCTIKHRGKKVLEICFFDSQFAGSVSSLEGDLSPVGSWKKTNSVKNSWKPLYGERNVIPENYNEGIWTIKDAETGGDALKIIFRAYDEGIAFCYEIPTKEGKSIQIKEEPAVFIFPGDYPCWAVYSAQGTYENVKLSQVKPNCERPLLVQIPDGPAVSIGEARLVDYARMRLQPYDEKRSDKSVLLTTQLAGPVEIKGTGNPFRTPWRFVMAADTPGQLLERNYMLLNLNDPYKIADTSWIKPGKVIRETTLSTKGGKACVDFAVERGLQYVEFDAGWYGPERDDKSDATKVAVDPNRPQGGLDLEEVIKYGNEKGVGVILYVNQKALARQLDELLPLYQKWGVRGIKFGFVHVGTQQWTTWLHEAIAKCAAHEIMVDVHDEYRSTGWERTYPNLMTVEGVRGNEEMPSAEHNIITAGVRMLCGPADYTPCWYDGRVQTSRSHQLALPVVIYSPWTFLFWYDKPEMYRGESELDLWKELPTVWDDTKILVCDLPRTIAVARRSGNTWYVGVLHSGEKTELTLPLERLLAGYANDAKLTATTYADKSDVPRDRGVEIRTTEMDETKSVTLPLRENGGAVIKIRSGE